ncbi:MAG: hypothetical protein QXY40_05010 [Candidatus Methanomethylicia archaeon]
MRDANGNPIIPGAGLKGFFKANFSRAIKGLGVANYEQYTWSFSC